jgi:hypothetical protein
MELPKHFGDIKILFKNNKILYTLSYYNYIWKYKPDKQSDIYNVISCINISKEAAIYNLLDIKQINNVIYNEKYNKEMTIKEFITNYQPTMISIVKKIEYSEDNFCNFKFEKYPSIIIKDVGEKLEKMDYQLHNQEPQELFLA